MERFPECELLQKNSITALTNATWLNGKLQSIVVELDGIQTIMSAMERHASSRDLQLVGLKFLNMMSFHLPNADLMVQKLNVLSLIVTVMKEFANDAEVVYEACLLLSSLTNVKGIKKQMRRANVITALAISIDSHKRNQEIQRHAWKLMKFLSDGKT